MDERQAPSATHWPDYYDVTAERPAWGTVMRAADAFGPVDQASPPLPFLQADDDASVWQRIGTAVRPGGRFSGMVFGDRDESAVRRLPPAVPRSGSIRAMSDLVPAASVPSADRVALADDAPSIEELFLFAREAELRVRSLRMVIDERSIGARGEEIVSHEVLMRHPGDAKVTSRRSDDPLDRDYTVWLSDGKVARTYKAAARTVSTREVLQGVVGREAKDLPLYAQQREVLTRLPSGTLADTFVHPHGLFRNVLITGPLAIIGTQSVHGREAIVVRAEHPRSAKVLVDRPDRSVEVGIDRTTGFLLSLTERIADAVTHHAVVTVLEVDPTFFDQTFELHVPADTRALY